MIKKECVLAAALLSFAWPATGQVPERGPRGARGSPITVDETRQQPPAGEVHQQVDPAEAPDSSTQDIDVGTPAPDFVAFLDDLRARFPNFQAVTAGEQDRWRHLTIPPMHLKHVTLSQVLNVLGDLFPGLQIRSEHMGGSRPVFVFSIPEGYVPGYSGENNVFQVIGLADAVERQVLSSAVANGQAPAVTAASRKQALDEVLSLIKAAVSEADPGAPPPDMKVHAETQTLLFKGNNRQVNAVSSVIQVVSRHAGPVDETAQLYTVRRDLQAQLNKADATIDDLHRRLLERDEELSQLKVRLKLSPAASAPRE